MAIILTVNINRNRDALLDVQIQFKAESNSVITTEAGDDLGEG